MIGGEYSYRPGWLSPAMTLRLENDGLAWKQGRREGHVAYGAVSQLRIYKVRFFGSSAGYWRCVLFHGRGRRLSLQAADWRSFRRIEDRTASYIPFVKELEARIAAANPQARFLAGRSWRAHVDALVAALTVQALRATSLVRVDWSGAAGAWLLRKLGPRLKGHRVARANLRAAYPGKDAGEIEQILLGMWSNLGRVAAEYGHLARLWDYDPDRARPGRVVLDESSRRHFLKLRDDKGPFLTFGGHLANWELLTWAAGSYRGESAIVYRAPKIGGLARELDRIRARSLATLIPADSSAMLKVKAALDRRAAIGLLVDEHSARGIDVQFFGRTCKVNPALAQFARHFECPIHGVRITRLRGSRFRFEIMDPLKPPRDEAGKIDVAATMQMVTSTIEAWIREHPEQWLWLMRRWR